MKTEIGRWLAVCAFAAVPFNAGAQLIGGSGDDGPESSPCITDATMQLGASPAVPPQKYSESGTGPWVPFIVARP